MVTSGDHGHCTGALPGITAHCPGSVQLWPCGPGGCRRAELVMGPNSLRVRNSVPELGISENLNMRFLPTGVEVWKFKILTFTFFPIDYW